LLVPTGFLLGLGLLVWRAERVGHAVYHTGAAAQADYLFRKMTDARVVVLGSSHAGLVHLDAMGLYGQNLWDVGQDLHEVAYKAAVVLPRLPKLELALISLSYHSFEFDNAAYVVNGKSPRMELRYKLYAAYPGYRPIPGDIENFVKGRLHTLVSEDHWQKALPHVFDWTLPETAPQPATSMRHPYERRKLDRNQLRDISQARVKRFAGFIRVMQRVRPNLEQELFESLKDTIARCRARGVRVVLFTPPYWDDFNALFPKQWQELMRSRGAELAQLPGVSYFDFSTDRRFRGQFALFADADHLRRAGARQFSVLLRKAIAGELSPER
jgi:hypothetical protein